MSDGHVIGRVAALMRYPVKSLQGEAMSAATFDLAGMEGDRAWGIVNVESGQVLTAKRTAQLLEAHARTADGSPELTLPDGTTLAGPGSATDAALSEWLGLEVSLRAPADAPTSFTMSFNVDDEDVDAFDWATPPGTFVDLAPVHILTTAALAAAAGVHPEGSWSSHRFRPGILVETDASLSGFLENEWVGQRVAIGEVVLEPSMPTVRCSMTTKAQSPHGIERDLEIFKSLKTSNSQNLGAYANVMIPGVVRVGDEVRVD